MSDARLFSCSRDVERLLAAIADRDPDKVQAVYDQADLPALVTSLGAQLLETRTELTTTNAIIHETRGIRPAGLSLSQAWEITNQSLDRKEAA